MFSPVESCRTNRANNRLVASSVMAIRYSFSPRPSSQSCTEVSHCASSPKRLRRGRQTCSTFVFCSFARHSFARDHPLPQGLLAHFNVVFVGQIFGSQRRPEPFVQIRRQDLHASSSTVFAIR